MELKLEYNRSRKMDSVPLGNILHYAQFLCIHATLEKGFDKLINLLINLPKHKPSLCPEAVSAWWWTSGKTVSGTVPLCLGLRARALKFCLPGTWTVLVTRVDV